MDKRLQELEHWLKHDIGLDYSSITLASEDASFRRYFRATTPKQSYIVMDAPPDKEDCTPYVTIAREMSAMGLNVPEIFEFDATQGFMLLTDLGTRQYLTELNKNTVEQLYGDAMRALSLLQGAKPPQDNLIPDYDNTLLMTEMDLFSEWFIDKHLNIKLDIDDKEALDQSFILLARNAQEQPRTWVHRDYHSRNLMVVSENNPGILDFQDAVTGPVSYDLVSLLRDCYIQWSHQQVEAWVRHYHALAIQKGIIGSCSATQFLRWFDLMGVQRHLKAIGIFARLNIRDNKPGFLADIPRTLSYIIDTCEHYPELAALHSALRETVLPAMADKPR